jgi:cobalt-zinc-cadmium efflux system membrane fusion protein
VTHRAAAFVLALAAGCAQHATVVKETAPEVAISRASFGTIDVTVRAVGRVGPASGNEAKLAFVVPGRLAGVSVHVGQQVSAGDVLARLESQPFVLAAQGAAADSQAAQAEARAAAVDRTSTRIAVDRAAYERAQRLFAAGVVARKDVEAAQAQLAADEAETRTNAANLAAARAAALSAGAKAALAARDAESTSLRSPIDGIVTAIYRQRGEAVDPTVAVVAVAPSKSGQVALLVTSSDALRVRAGDAVRLRANGAAFAGTVVGVSDAVDLSTQSAEVDVRAAVPSALAGTAVDATIVVATDRGIVIPKSAIVSDPTSGKTLVFVAGKDKNGDPEFDERDVHVVFANEKDAEVTGLRAGEQIATSGAFELLPPAGGG